MLLLNKPRSKCQHSLAPTDHQQKGQALILTGMALLRPDKGTFSTSWNSEACRGSCSVFGVLPVPCYLSSGHESHTAISVSFQRTDSTAKSLQQGQEDLKRWVTLESTAQCRSESQTWLLTSSFLAVLSGKLYTEVSKLQVHDLQVQTYRTAGWSCKEEKYKNKPKQKNKERQAEKEAYFVFSSLQGEAGLTPTSR